MFGFQVLAIKLLKRQEPEGSTRVRREPMRATVGVKVTKSQDNALKFKARYLLVRRSSSFSTKRKEPGVASAPDASKFRLGRIFELLSLYK
jgi:hypothetical protein